MRFYYFFRENGKRNEISSRILKNNILSRTREDEKKDGVMGIFRRIFGKSNGLVYGSSENPRPLQNSDAVKEDLRATMAHFRELKASIPSCIKEAELKMLAADARAEDCEKRFNDLLLSIYDDGGNFWKNKDSYPEASDLWYQLHSSAIERTEALKELREWNRMFYLAYGYKYKSEMCKDLCFHVNGMLI